MNQPMDTHLLGIDGSYEAERRIAHYVEVHPDVYFGGMKGNDVPYVLSGW